MTVQTETYFYETAKGHGLPHDPFKAIVAPRPIGWISTVDHEGQVNLAPYSFFNAVCGAPPIIAFSSEGYKDSVRNAEETGEFVANFVNKPLAEQMNRTSAPVTPEIFGGTRQHRWAAEKLHDAHIRLTRMEGSRAEFPELELDLWGEPQVRLFLGHPQSELQQFVRAIRRLQPPAPTAG